MTVDERQLIAAARKGDIPAFEALVRRHHRTLYKFALGITRGNEHDAADILQDALIKAFLGIDRFEERSSFPSWLWRIIRNEFLDRIRAQRLETVSLDEEEAEGCEPGHHDTPEKQLSDEERKRHLLGLVAALPEKHSEIVILVELMELSYEDAAEYLAIPVGSVRSRLSRAREQLTESVKKNMELFSAVGRHTG